MRGGTSNRFLQQLNSNRRRKLPQRRGLTIQIHRRKTRKLPNIWRARRQQTIEKLGKDLPKKIRASSRKQPGAAEDMAFVILCYNVHGIRTVELIQFRVILGSKFPAKLFDEYLVTIAGNLRIQPLRKPLWST